jgi:hypothetical protein
MVLTTVGLTPYGLTTDEFTTYSVTTYLITTDGFITDGLTDGTVTNDGFYDVFLPVCPAAAEEFG